MTARTGWQCQVVLDAWTRVWKIWSLLSEHCLQCPTGANSSLSHVRAGGRVFSVAGSRVLAGCLLFCGRVSIYFKKCPVGEAGSIWAEELQVGWKSLGAGWESLCMASATVTQLLTASLTATCWPHVHPRHGDPPS